MRSRIRWPSPATVIATLALCVAVGTGYSLAFSGSGSVQRSKEVGIIGPAAFERVATLPGIGFLQANCSGSGSPVSLRFKNTSGKRLVSRAFEENSGDFASSEPANDGLSSTVVVGVGAETVHWLLSPAGARARPQADMSVTVTPSVSGSPSCAKAEVAVIATTTEG